MATKPKSTKQRANLTREKILDTAIILANTHGINTLSMRKLAEELGAGTMSLYNHIANKDELLDGILDKALSEIDDSTDELNWTHAVRQRALSTRRVFSKYNWAIELMGANLKPGFAQVKYANRVLAELRRAGFSPATAIQISSVVDSYVYGFLQKERSRPFKTTNELVTLARSAMLETAMKDYPYVLEAVQDLLANPEQYDVDKDFQYGLDLILSGLQETSSPS